MGTFRVVNSEFVKWAAAYEGPKFHACLCDPPYGLEFMQNTWDAPWQFGFTAPGIGERKTDWPGFSSTENPTCAKCGGRLRGANRCQCPEPEWKPIGKRRGQTEATTFPKPGNLGGFADGNKPSFARQGDIGAKYQKWAQEWAEAVMPLLHPGALVFAFGGTRMWHRLACGFEDAGFQMWDTLMWLHGQGFPKAQDISKLIDKKNGNERGAVIGQSSGPNNSQYEGERYSEPRETAFGVVQDQPLRTAPGSEASAPWAGHKTAAFKPAWEPVLCFRAPANGKTYAELALEFGSGCLNVDAGRIEGPRGDGVWGSSNETCKPTFNDSPEQQEFRSAAHELGRYPANVALECICPPEGDRPSGHPDPECPSAQLDEQSGDCSSSRANGNPNNPKRGGNSTPAWGMSDGAETVDHRDTGGASRFFFQTHTDPECPAAILDEQSGEQPSGGFPERRSGKKTGPIYGAYKDEGDLIVQRGRTFGTASRFFYTAKASNSERNDGLYGDADLGTKHGATLREVENSVKKRETPMAGRGQGGLKCMKCDRWKVSGNPCTCHEPEFVEVKFNSPEQLNTHPTVKPVALTTWLAKLLLPADSVSPRRLLVPFSGSGSEIIGALRAGWDDVLGVDQDADYCEIASARIYADAPLFNVEVK